MTNTRKMIIELELDWDKDLEQIKKVTGASKQWQVRQAIQMWIASKKLSENK